MVFTDMTNQVSAIDGFFDLSTFDNLDIQSVTSEMPALPEEFLAAPHGPAMSYSIIDEVQHQVTAQNNNDTVIVANPAQLNRLLQPYTPYKILGMSEISISIDSPSHARSLGRPSPLLQANGLPIAPHFVNLKEEITWYRSLCKGKRATTARQPGESLADYAARLKLRVHNRYYKAKSRADLAKRFPRRERKVQIRRRRQAKRYEEDSEEDMDSDNDFDCKEDHAARSQATLPVVGQIPLPPMAMANTQSYGLPMPNPECAFPVAQTYNPHFGGYVNPGYNFAIDPQLVMPKMSSQQEVLARITTPQPEQSQGPAQVQTKKIQQPERRQTRAMTAATATAIAAISKEDTAIPEVVETETFLPSAAYDFMSDEEFAKLLKSNL